MSMLHGMLSRLNRATATQALMVGGMLLAVVLTGPPSSKADDVKELGAVILATTEDVWHRIFGELGKAYVEPTLVLYTSATFSACGTVTPNDGANFYCPSDQKIYFDPDGVSTYAPAGDPLGDYLTVWLIARGVSEHVQQMFDEAGPTADRRLASLQADCLVGVWSKSPESLLTANEFSILSTALTRVAEREPNSRTFGTPVERLHWLRVGHASGRIEDCGFGSE